MDDIVKAALKKWPNVPHCYDWLALDARGDWYLRDEQVQHAGPFPQLKGSRILHDKLKEFIHRNYDVDAQGCWFFQNGPQRVYVMLEAAPLVLGVQALAQGGYRIETHTGQVVPDVRAVHVDEQGRLFMATSAGLGIVRSMDMLTATDAMEAMGWTPDELSFADLPGRYGYQLRPRPAEVVPA